MSKIPSDEELNRASKKMDQRFSSLDAVKNNVVKHFKSKCPLYDFRILPQGDNGFRAYVFLETDCDIEECTKNGTVDELKQFVVQELTSAGKWTENKTVIAFELDSDENVTANYEGDYFLRLR